MIEKNNDNLETLIGPYSKHCKGYVNSGRNCYLCAITLHTAVIDETSTEKLHSNILPIKSIYKLNAFDLCRIFWGLRGPNKYDNGVILFWTYGIFVGIRFRFT